MIDYKRQLTADGDVKVLRLDGRESRQFDVELCQVSTSDFFVKFLGQDVDTEREFLRGSPESNLRKGLVGKGARHDEGRVSSAASTTAVSNGAFDDSILHTQG